MSTSTGILFGDPQVKPLSSTGTYQPGCYLYFYVTGTTTETNVYANGSLTTPLTQPVTADSTGRFVPIYLNPATLYRVQLYNSGGTKLEDTDPYVVPVVGAFLWPQSAVEVANSVTPTNYGYEWGDPRRYGAVGNGTTDDTTAMQACAGSGIWKLTPGASYYISNLITLHYVNIIPALASSITASPNAAIVGSGSLRGVINNPAIPHQLFQVKYNLVTAAERAPVTITANYWIDPLLGSDSNAGTSPGAAIATLTHAIALVTAVAGTASSLLIVLRSGRHEQPLGGSTLNSYQSLTSGGTVTWTANPGELPVVTPTTYWFFNSSMKTVSYNGCYGVNNTAGFAFCDLFDAETGLPVPIASNMRANFGLPRNQVAGGQIVETGSSSPWTITITLTTDDTAAWNAMTATEQAGVQLRITQKYTSSWHDNLSLSGSVMSMNAYTNTSTYYNGFASVGSVVGSSSGAPYFMRNLKYYLDGTNFAAYSNNVYLPNKGTNYFTVDDTCMALVSMTTAANHTWQGIAFRYMTATLQQLKEYYNPSPFNEVGLLVGGAGLNLQALNCYFEYGAFNGFQLGYTGSQALRNQVNHVGMSGISYSNAENGADGSLVKWNKIRHWGDLHISVAGIYQAGVGIGCYLNDVRNGASQAIHIDSQYGLINKTGSGTASGTVRNNVALNVGMINGAICDLYCACDTGVMYAFGGGPLAFSSLSILGNVFGPSYVYGVGKGIYLDGGCNGVNCSGNLVWGSPDYALFVYQNGANTNDNYVTNNLLLGEVWFDATLAHPSNLSNNVIGGLIGSSTQSVPNNITPTNIDISSNVVFTEPNLFGCRVDVGYDYPVIWANDPAWELLLSGSLGSIWLVDPFVLSYVRRGSMVGSPGPIYNSTSMPTSPITTTTYTVGDNDYALVFNTAAGCTIKLPQSFTTSTPMRGGAGRELLIKTVAAGAIVSANSNVYPQSLTTLGTAILAATAGKFARLKADGTGNWWIMESN